MVAGQSPQAVQLGVQPDDRRLAFALQLRWQLGLCLWCWQNLVLRQSLAALQVRAAAVKPLTPAEQQAVHCQIYKVLV